MDRNNQKNTYRPSFESEWKQRFEQFAATSEDDAGIAGWSQSGLETRLQYFTKLWKKTDVGSQWLDAGCGAGTYSRFLAKEKMNVVGLDYSLPTIFKARQRNKYDNSWIVADVTKLPLKSQIFDGILCFGVVQALENSRGLTEELARVVKPGGQVWVDALNVWCVKNMWERCYRKVRGRPKHLHYEYPSKLKDNLESQNLVCLNTHWLLIVPANWRLLKRLIESKFMKMMLKIFPVFRTLLSHSVLLECERKN